MNNSSNNQGNSTEFRWGIGPGTYPARIHGAKYDKDTRGDVCIAFSAIFEVDDEGRSVERSLDARLFFDKEAREEGKKSGLEKSCEVLSAAGVKWPIDSLAALTGAKISIVVEIENGYPKVKWVNPTGGAFREVKLFNEPNQKEADTFLKALNSKMASLVNASSASGAQSMNGAAARSAAQGAKPASPAARAAAQSEKPPF